jgi:hypothetical protein
MTCDSSFARRRLPELLFLVVASSLLGVSAASAQECLGYEQRDVITGGTNGVESIHLADMDGDGDLDILSASFGDGSIYWFENDWDPTWDPNDPMQFPSFKAQLISGGLDNASSVYAADFDGDGDTDVVGSSRDENGVFWYEQAQGLSPIFSARTVSRTTALPLSVFAIDVDGDGDIDVLSASFLDNTIAWHENVGGTPPSFTKHVITTSALGAASVFAIDMDGDGDIDVISASRLAVPFTGTEPSPEESWGIAWYEQTDQVDEETQEIIFIPREVWTTSMGATSVYAADVDGDGDTDVLSATNADNTIAWHESTPGPNPEDPPTFTPRIISDQAMGARSVVTGDLDGDGSLDVLSASQRDDKIAWYTSDGGTPPNFTEEVITTDANHADDARVGDLDGDGDLDIVTASSVPGFPASQDVIRWYENRPGQSPQFVSPDENEVYFSADGAISAVAADLDGDDDEDVATAGRTNQIAWYISDGAELPGFEETVISVNALGASDIEAADLDGDGRIDLVSASRDDNKIAWYENNLGQDGLPEFTEIPISTEVVNAWDVYVVDLDDDMNLDILAAANRPVELDSEGNRQPVPAIYWFRSNGADPPEFTPIVISDNAPGARSVHAGDIDSNGTLDVVWASYDDFKIAWKGNTPGPNPGDLPTFSDEQVVTTRAFGPSSVFVADIDGDTQVDDILAAESISFNVAWYERVLQIDPDTGDESFTYTRYTIANSADDASSAIAYDLNGDDAVDVIATAPGDQAIGWFENLGGSPPVWSTHVVTQNADYSQKVAVGDLNNDDQLDIVSGSRLSVFWYEGSGETCDMFDANGDGVIDGIELAWIGRSFGRLSTDPATQWWAGVDFNRDGMIDGEDLAILSSPGVFGFTTETCVYICR